MREIKFRGRDDLTNNGWLYGDFGHGYYWNSCEIDGVIVNNSTIGQYTGRRDVNRQDAYEGDIIKFHDEFGHEHVGVIKWHERACRWYVDCSFAYDFVYDVSFPFDARFAFEILGNIYDNPELLEVNDDA